MGSKTDRTVDVLVIGSGGAGLTAAATSRAAGLSVLVAEKDSVFGGTTATSGGVIWIPMNRHAQKLGAEIGVEDTIANARHYLENETGQYIDRDRIEAYLASGPVMVDFMERETEVKFHSMEFPDYHSDEPGASTIRSLGTLPYDAGQMGPLMKRLKGELPQTLFMGLALGSSLEMKNFLKAGRSITAMGFVVKRMLRHFRDLALHGSSQNIVRGRALIARLAKTLDEAGVEIWTDSPATELTTENGRVTGARLATPDGTVTIRATYGVVLAAGGYPRDRERRRENHPGVTATMEPVLPVPMTNTGDGSRLAEAVGGRWNGHVSTAAAWMPTSKLPGATDFTGVWPHLVDRTKPGFIMVTPDGRRLVNESQNYRDLIPAMLEDLARVCGIDGPELVATFERFNGFARSGDDLDYHRGRTKYDRHHGDDENTPNPSLGPLEVGPFFSVRIYPGEITSYKGMATDIHARVLGHDDQPIAGLYAVGNDQANVFGGAYPGAGATIGPGMVFGWRAGKHLAEVAGKSLPGVTGETERLAAD